MNGLSQMGSNIDSERGMAFMSPILAVVVFIGCGAAGCYDTKTKAVAEVRATAAAMDTAKPETDAGQAWDSTAEQPPPSVVAEHPTGATAERLAHPISRAELKRRLDALAKSEVPNTRQITVIGLVFLPPPRWAEYICPVCGEKTLYSLSQKQLTSEEIKAGMRAIEPAVQHCSRGQTGMVVVSLEVAEDGSVASAQTIGEFANTPVGLCAARAVKSSRFPKKQSSTRLSFPFEIGSRTKMSEDRFEAPVAKSPSDSGAFGERPVKDSYDMRRVIGIPRCRRLVETIRSKGLWAELDETQFCERCAPSDLSLESPRLALLIQYPEDQGPGTAGAEQERKGEVMPKPHRLSDVDAGELEIIAQFLEGKTVYIDDDEFERPMKEFVGLLSELLDIKIKAAVGAPGPDPR